MVCVWAGVGRYDMFDFKAGAPAVSKFNMPKDVKVRGYCYELLLSCMVANC
jgi:hypothetical protein